MKASVVERIESFEGGWECQGDPVASGVYFYTLETGDFTATRKVVILK